MKIFYVIKDPINGKYLSTQDKWDELFMSIDFSEENDAIKYAYNNLDTYFTIEKIYNSNQN